MKRLTETRPLFMRVSPEEEAALLLIQRWLLLRLRRKPSMRRVLRFLMACFQVLQKESREGVERAIAIAFADGKVK